MRIVSIWKVGDVLIIIKSGFLRKLLIWNFFRLFTLKFLKMMQYSYWDAFTNRFSSTSRSELCMQTRNMWSFSFLKEMMKWISFRFRLGVFFRKNHEWGGCIKIFSVFQIQKSLIVYIYIGVIRRKNFSSNWLESVESSGYVDFNHIFPTVCIFKSDENCFQNYK